MLGKTYYYTLSTLKYWDKDEKQADAYFCHLLLECGYKHEVGYAYLLYTFAIIRIYEDIC